MNPRPKQRGSIPPEPRGGPADDADLGTLEDETTDAALTRGDDDPIDRTIEGSLPEVLDEPPTDERTRHDLRAVPLRAPKALPASTSSAKEGGLRRDVGVTPSPKKPGLLEFMEQSTFDGAMKRPKARRPEPAPPSETPGAPLVAQPLAPRTRDPPPKGGTTPDEPVVPAELDGPDEELHTHLDARVALGLPIEAPAPRPTLRPDGGEAGGAQGTDEASVPVETNDEPMGEPAAPREPTALRAIKEIAPRTAPVRAPTAFQRQEVAAPRPPFLSRSEWALIVTLVLLSAAFTALFDAREVRRQWARAASASPWRPAPKLAPAPRPELEARPRRPGRALPPEARRERMLALVDRPKLPPAPASPSRPPPSEDDPPPDEPDPPAPLRAGPAPTPSIIRRTTVRPDEAAARPAAGGAPLAYPRDPDAVLTVLSQPPGATVEVEGRTLGKTPLGQRAPGSGDRLEVRVHLAGHTPWTGEVVPAESGNFDLSVQLQPKRGRR